MAILRIQRSLLSMQLLECSRQSSVFSRQENPRPGAGICVLFLKTDD